MYIPLKEKALRIMKVSKSHMIQDQGRKGGGGDYHSIISFLIGINPDPLSD